MSSEGRFTLLKARLGKVTSGDTIKLSVRERVRDQKMEPANEMYSLKKCLGGGGGGPEDSIKLFISQHLSPGKPSQSLRNTGCGVGEPCL